MLYLRAVKLNSYHMKNAYYFLIVLFLIITSCNDSSKRYIYITETNFSDEVSLQTNLIFRFNRDIVSDTLLGYWDTTNYVTFEPEIEGKFKWQTPNTLVFSPFSVLKASCKYTANINSSLLKLNKNIKLAKEKSIEFHTSYIKLVSSSTYWAEYKDKKAIYFNIAFNYPVEPAQLYDKLLVNIDNKDYDFKIITNDNSKRITIVVDNFPVTDEDLSAKLILKQGISAVNGNVPTQNEITKNLSLQSPYKFSVYDITANHNGDSGTLTVVTSQEADENNIKDFINIEPEIKFSIQVKTQEIIITSEDFKLNNKYDITIKKGLDGKIGGTLKHEFNKEISFGKLKPSIKFANKNSYLTSLGNKNIQVNIVSIDEVEVQIYKVYENNIIQFINGMYQNYDYENDSYYTYINTYNLDNLGDIVFKKDIKTKELTSYNGGKILNLDFKDKLINKQGIYILKIVSKEKRWLKATKVVSISDIGLIAKKGKNVLSVFANSISTAEAIPGVKINFFGKNNQISGSAITDDMGVASFNISDLPAEGFDVRMITAQKDNDFNYLAFSKSFVNTSRYNIGGKYENLSGFDAFIYAERELYRPGETINISGIIRDKEWNPPSPVPVIIKLTAPNGKEIKNIRKTIGEQGDFEVSVKLDVSSMTGNYIAQLYTSNNVFLGSKKIAVEEFMPDRIKVKLKLNKKVMDMKDKLQVDILAENYFGPPAANRNYESELSIKRKSFSAKTKKRYNFHIDGSDSYFESILRDGRTDVSGEAKEEYNIPKQYANMGLLQADVYVTVFDETGRPVSRLKSVDVFTQDVFYGLGQGSYYLKTGNFANIPLIAIDKKGNIPDSAEAEIRLIKHEWRTVLSHSGSYFRYKSEHFENVIETKKILLKGEETSYSFTPELSGEYEIRISKPGINTYVSRSFWSYGWGNTTSSSYQVNSEGHIDIEFDKDKYNVGETAKVLLKAPFNGKILVSLEDNDISKYFYLETDKKAASFELKITDEYVPNIYISATLIKAHKETDFPLTVAHGFAPVMVENNKHKIDVSIKADKKSRSNTIQKIEVSAKANSSITIAVVDEGILGITGYQTPDPYEYFFRKKALEVKSYDLYPYLLPEMNIENSKTGGDEMGLEKRINPLTSKRVKLVSFWSGIIKTNSKGKAYFDIDIPQFSGSLRIMAVSYKDNSFGSASQNIIVSDPIVISTALPRFLSPADTIDIPVSVSNTTDKTADCKVKIALQGAIDIIGTGKQSVNIPTNSEGEVVFHLSVKKEIGQAKVNVSVNALDEEFTNSTDITIRPAAPLQKISGSGSIKAGETETVRMAMSNFIEGSISNKLVISKSPLIEFSDDLDYLVRYPYGCVEQTVSSVFPQLYFNDLVRDIYKRDNDNLNPDYNIKQAISKLMLMQLYNGGLTYWQGNGTESWWGSIYACHFLLEAKKAGYDVNNSFLDKLVSYLKTKLKEKRTVTYYYNSNMRKEIFAKEATYSLFVLALAGKPQYSSMNYYKSHQNKLSLDSKYLLAAAFALSGNMKSYRELLPAEFEGEISKNSFSGSFYSYIRDEAISLYVMLEVDPDNEQIGILAKHLTEQVKKRRYLNTQERAFTFLSLGKIARMSNASDIKANIKANGKEIAKYDNKLITIEDNSLPNSNIEIETNGKGSIYYYWVAEGISADGSYKQEDSFLKVRKKFYNRQGQRIYDLNFKQNELIVVKIEIQTNNNEWVDNIAICDILPAGFEIENTRLKDIPDMHWIKHQSSPDFKDIRDDRIILFVSAYNQPTNYYYFVRAVSPGIYQMGPVGADAMYNGEYHSYNGAGVVTITR